MMLEYDFIILGAGASGLSLLMRILDSKEICDKRVLLIDKEKKATNDKTWCFWERSEGYFESIVPNRIRLKLGTAKMTKNKSFFSKKPVLFL